MDRQRTMIIAAVTLGAVAASTAAVLGVPAMGSAVPVEQPVSAQSVGTPASLYGTSVVLPEGIAAFSLDESGLVSVGDAGRLNQATMDGIEQQLADAPPQSSACSPNRWVSPSWVNVVLIPPALSPPSALE